MASACGGLASRAAHTGGSIAAGLGKVGSLTVKPNPEPSPSLALVLALALALALTLTLTLT